MHIERYLKTKVKSCEDKLNTDFHDDELPRKGPHCICLSLILIDSVYKMGERYYPQVFFRRMQIHYQMHYQ